MARTISEEKVLKKLGITDFRHMTKEKVVKFATMLPHMDPEVAKKALEQFPSFKDLASDLVGQYKSIVETTCNSNDVSQNAFYEACNNIIRSLQKELEDGEITGNERERIEDKMIEVAKIIGEKDSENKGFLLKLAASGAVLAATVIGVGGAILGANSQISKKDDDDDNEV